MSKPTLLDLHVIGAVRDAHKAHTSENATRDLPENKAAQLHNMLYAKLTEAVPRRACYMFAFKENRQACSAYLTALARALDECDIASMSNL